MTLEDQIKYTEQELASYKDSPFSAPEIVQWLVSVLSSLKELEVKKKPQ